MTDNKLYVKRVWDISTNIVVTLGSSMWGKAMFGASNLLGAAIFTITVSEDRAVIRVFDKITSGFLFFRPGMWGSAMFGSVNILGAYATITYNGEGKSVSPTDISVNIIRSS